MEVSVILTQCMCYLLYRRLIGDMVNRTDSWIFQSPYTKEHNFTAFVSGGAALKMNLSFSFFNLIQLVD